jgi:hypothetical protein
MELQDELRFTQVGKTEAARIAIRIVITLGDVLHQNNDVFGDAVNLAARIEKITPPDETYLSQAAWLALNKGEIQTSCVGQFPFHGMSEPVSVHKIEHETHTRIMRQQTIVLTDLRGFSAELTPKSWTLFRRFGRKSILVVDQARSAIGVSARPGASPERAWAVPFQGLGLAERVQSTTREGQRRPAHAGRGSGHLLSAVARQMKQKAR